MTRKRGPRRHPIVIEYRDDHANTVAREQVPPKRSPSLEPAEEKVPRDQCLARVVCSSGHVFAVVRRPVRGTPALAVIAGPPGPGYYAALRPEGWRYLRGPIRRGSITTSASRWRAWSCRAAHAGSGPSCSGPTSRMIPGRTRLRSSRLGRHLRHRSDPAGGLPATPRRQGHPLAASAEHSRPGGAMASEPRAFPAAVTSPASFRKTRAALSRWGAGPFGLSSAQSKPALSKEPGFTIRRNGLTPGRSPVQLALGGCKQRPPSSSCAVAEGRGCPPAVGAQGRAAPTPVSPWAPCPRVRSPRGSHIEFPVPPDRGDGALLRSSRQSCARTPHGALGAVDRGAGATGVELTRVPPAGSTAPQPLSPDGLAGLPDVRSAASRSQGRRARDDSVSAAEQRESA